MIYLIASPQTIDDVLERGNKLDDISAKSRDLADDSKKYKWGAKKLNTMVSHHCLKILIDLSSPRF